MAKDTIRTGIQRCTAQALHCCRLYFNLASIHLSLSEPTLALETIGQGLSYAAGYGVPVLELFLHLAKAYCHISQREFTQALAVLEFCKVQLAQLKASQDVCEGGAKVELEVMLLVLRFACVHHLEGVR